MKIYLIWKMMLENFMKWGLKGGFKFLMMMIPLLWSNQLNSKSFTKYGRWSLTILWSGVWKGNLNLLMMIPLHIAKPAEVKMIGDKNVRAEVSANFHSNKLSYTRKIKIVGFSCIFLQKFSEILSEHARLLSRSECC